MKFIHVAAQFEKIGAESSRLSMTALLASLLKEATPQESYIICTLSLGLLRPAYLGNQFNLAQKNCGNVVAQLLDVPIKKITDLTKELGDLGSVVALGQWHPHKKLTLLEVYDQLCYIENISGTGSQEEKTNLLVALLQSLDPLSAKYVIRIILGTLRLGFSDMTIIDSLSWMEVGDKSLRTDIEHAYNVCADIGMIASTLKTGGIKAIHHMHIKLGVPIRPSAAERLPHAIAVFEKLGDCVAQPKLDGFRLQLHVDKTDPKNPIVKFFSRNLIDMSAMFPDIVTAALELDVTTLICEGEAIAFDVDTGSFLPFQQTVKRKRKHDIEQAIADYPLHVYIFDLLYLNGTQYLNKKHTERRRILLDVFSTFNNSLIQVLEEKEINSAQQLEQYFAQNISSGLEGLVVKKPNAIYQPGKRNFNWIKLKRQEEGHLEDTLDCVVLGYYTGSGKRSHFGIGAFLVGVFNPALDAFQTIAKIGTGLKDDEWRDLKKRADAIQSNEQPHNVICAKELQPDVWTYPEIVCAIRADEITKSPLHAAGKTEDQLGFALRFPRIMGYRPDKSALEATTVEEVKRLFDDQFI